MSYLSNVGTVARTHNVYTPVIHLTHSAASYSQSSRRHYAATMPPDDQEFGYRFNVGNAWGTTLFSRKVEIAHARAIQKQAYGRNQWSGTQCSHCVKQGYSCRVYTDFILINSPQLLLGYACQHCRLWGKDCDVLRITGASRPISRQGTSLVEHQSKPARHVSIDVSSEATETTPEPADPKPTLASRITKVDTRGSPRLERGAKAPSQDMIDQIAHKIGLKLDGSGCIYDMYADWSSADLLRVPRKYDWETIYSSFVDLYIITNHTRQSELQ
jgi:hypothetical protein